MIWEKDCGNPDKSHDSNRNEMNRFDSRYTWKVSHVPSSQFALMRE